MKEYWASLASILGVLAFCQSLLHVLFPLELRFAFLRLLHRVFNRFTSYSYFDITEIDGVNTNELYNAVQLYLSSSLISIAGSRLSLTHALNSTAITFGLTNNDSITDTFRGITVVWENIVTKRHSQTFSWRPLPEEKRGFTLRIRKKDKNLILDSYLDHIVDTANEIRRRNQGRLLYTNSRGGSLDARGHPWESVPFKHPSTFDTLAMDPALKSRIMQDLKDFASGQSFYQRTGRAWKRGYLLYGPPGTGKSSMIAAMANFLGYDIYDLKLTEVHTNSELRKLLMKTSSKSIIVIEDIDCSVNLSNRKRNSSNNASSNDGSVGRGYPVPDPEMKSRSSEEGGNSITLSGLLNFTGGLWSCCGSERISIFTTNHIDKLDPALLQSGRMGMHIFMSYCSFPALKILLQNYLGLEEEDLEVKVLKELEVLVEEAEMTPADISEVLIKNRRNKDTAVLELVEALKLKKLRNGGAVLVSGRDEENLSSNLGQVVVVEEEEEQESKRALLESNSNDDEGCFDLAESCKKAEDEEKIDSFTVAAVETAVSVVNVSEGL